jgi:hypothetical protein
MGFAGCDLAHVDEPRDPASGVVAEERAERAREAEELAVRSRASVW